MIIATRPALSAIALLLLAPVRTSPAAPLDRLPQGIESRAPQTEHAVTVAGLELGGEVVTLSLVRGTLIPVSPVGDRTAEFLFLGDGWLRAIPPDEVERGQLEMFAGTPRLETAFDAAVLVVGNDGIAGSLLDGRDAAAPSPEDAERARTIFREWNDSPEIRALQAEGALLRDAARDPAMESYFLAWLRGTPYGDLVFSVDPEAAEQIDLGRFVPVDLTRKEEKRMRREIAAEQRRGGRIGLRIEDVGSLDTWISAPLRDAAGEPAPGHQPFEPEHYTLTLDVGKDRRVQGGARIDLVAVDEGARGLSFGLTSDVEVLHVLDEAGNALPFHREGSALAVALVGPVSRGEKISLLIAYAGSPFLKIDSTTFALSVPAGWYPRTGTMDRATYDVTIRHPARYDVLASGTLQESGEDADGTHWVRHVHATPAAHFSFEIGDFDVNRDFLGTIRITVAFDRESRHLPDDVRKEIRRTVKDALDYFQGIYGPYPLDELTVVTAPRAFSQGFLGFVTLSDHALSDFGGWRGLLEMNDRRATIAHEIAHQWWGNVVGWETYRDQWLIEAMANYSAILYARHRTRGPERIVEGPLSGWRGQLLVTTRDGRPVESLGPVILGRRLDSSLYPAAYEAIVYLKGTMVLGTLARVFGEEQFLEMLSDVVRLGSGRRITTEAFLSSLEAISGLDLDWFGDRFVRGTGIPEVEYSYEFQPRDGGGYWVVGEAHQHAAYRFSYSVVRTPSGGYDVRRERIDQMDVAGLHLLVPFQVVLETARADRAPKVVSGSLLLSGQRTPFRMEVDGKPAQFWLDRESEALATFYCETRHPKRAGFRRATDLAAAGSIEAAEAVFRAALEAPAVAEPSPLPVSTDGEGRMLDARIHLGLARLYLDQDRDAEAREEFHRGREILEQDRRHDLDATLRNLESRLEVRGGDYEPAFRRLRRLTQARDRAIDTETLLLLAIAAHGTGQEEELARMRARAALHGADLSQLPALREP